jgi:hypothetical protein
VKFIFETFQKSDLCLKLNRTHSKPIIIESNVDKALLVSMIWFSAYISQLLLCRLGVLNREGGMKKINDF